MKGGKQGRRGGGEKGLLFNIQAVNSGNIYFIIFDMYIILEKQKNKAFFTSLKQSDIYIYIMYYIQ